METQTWFDKWRDKIIAIIVVVIAIGGYFYFNPPKNIHEINTTAEVKTIDAVILKVNWTGTYDAKYYFPDEDKIQVESNLKMLTWMRLSKLALEYESYRIDKMGIDSLRILLNKDEQIQKLKSMNIRININRISFEESYYDNLSKRDSLQKNSLVLNKNNNEGHN